MINNTNLLTGNEARKKIKSAINKIYDTVRITLGPEGKNALLPRTYNRGPRITNDGIAIAELARLFTDPHERLAAESFVEGSSKTNKLVGDGTTATSVIAGTLFNDVSHDNESDNVQVIGRNIKKRGMRSLRAELIETKNKVIEEIKAQAKPIKTLADLEKIAVISIGKEDEKIAKVIAGMVWKIARDDKGKYVDNHVDVIEGYKGEIETSLSSGFHFPAKIANKIFINNPDRFEMIVEDTNIVITNTKLDNCNTVNDAILRSGTKKCTIFSPGFSAPVLTLFANSIMKGGVQVYPILCPSLRTEQMEDLAIYSGATVLDKAKGETIESLTKEHLGYAEKITVKDVENKDDAILRGGKGNPKEIEKRSLTLKKQRLEAKNELLRIQLDRRIANMQSTIGIIRVGATTENESLFLKLKIEDGVYACKAALEEGYVQGGGLCLKKIADKMGKNIMQNALLAPYNQIQENAGGIEIGKDVIDPAKVIRLEVEHGVSVASMLLTCDISIPEVQEKNEYDGMHELSQAMNKLAFYFGKHHSLIKENDDLEKQMMNDEFERVVEMDKG